MLRISFLFVALLTALTARAEPEFCRTAYCDPGNGIWYPRVPLGAAYGRDVKLSPDGEWIDRDGHRSWAPGSSRTGRVLSAANSDERNGELAYQTAYDSFMEGKFSGGNRVERVSVGRWVTKITTPDGIVMYKDASHNVAVQSPDGKWHVTNARGQYASTTLELETRAIPKAMVARAAKKGNPVAKAARKGKVGQVAKKAKGDGGRKLASVEPAAAPPTPDAKSGGDAQLAEAEAKAAADAKPVPPETASAVDAIKAAEALKAAEAAKPAAPPAKGADAGKGGEQLLPMDQLAKLAESSRAPASAEAKPIADAKPAADAAKPAEAVKPADVVKPGEPAKPAPPPAAEAAKPAGK